MNIFVSGINHKTTSIDIREKLKFTRESGQEVLREIIKIPEVKACVLLSTCNRTEVYIHSENSTFYRGEIEKILCEIKGFDLYSFKKHFYFYTSKKAVEHVFKVACGMDSQILGEDQILAQVKDAHFIALECGTGNDVLNTLFRESITCAKKVKTFTALSKNSVSAGSLAVKLVKDYFKGNIKNKCALVVGTGEIGAVSLKYLMSEDVGKVYVTNRTHGKADSLSKQYDDVLAIDYKDRYSVINECDIIISATSSPHYTITKDMLEKNIIDYKKRIIVDLAVPRDIDLAVEKLSGIEYFNMDNLKITVDKNIDKRLLEVSKAEKIIEKFLVEYERWYEVRNVFPVMKDVRKYVQNLVDERLEEGFSKLESCNKEDREVMQVLVKGIANEIMNKFVYSVKECGSVDEVSTYFKCLNSVINNEWEK
ncbi:glutamyl-tRNA reductase [Herbivorax sp. ANBcel31]|uniref:glutamyl-tRNA reductase n=1 Tax=Herbivorax sp. ANBcel31 TaxID=3069754 RepID=UPI0027B01687|nr:glutamyl-tRNA reductase [Herbivorax sp. ANBcel31]MDQ2086950.1 glutamyl-tRNA reductase [Herbivorax sp. ANBcel31]